MSEYQEDSDSCGHLHKVKVFQVHGVNSGILELNKDGYFGLHQNKLNPEMPVDTVLAWLEANFCGGFPDNSKYV